MNLVLRFFPIAEYNLDPNILWQAHLPIDDHPITLFLI